MKLHRDLHVHTCTYMYIHVLTDLPLHVPLLEAVLHPLQALLLSLLRVLHGVLVHADCHESREVNVIVQSTFSVSTIQIIVHHYRVHILIRILYRAVDLSECLSRFFVICYPMKAQYMSTPRRARVILSIVWPLAFAMSLPMAFKAVTTGSHRQRSCIHVPRFGRSLDGKWAIRVRGQETCCIHYKCAVEH